MKHRVFFLAVLSGCVGGIGGAPPGPGRQAAPGTPPPGTPPPIGQPRPPDGPGAAPPPVLERDPGRVALRRLNRSEYNNTVRDLLGTRLRPADAFAADPAGLGFDNNGDVQTLGALQLEQYETAAHALADEVLAAGPAKLAAIGRTPACDPAREGRACAERMVTAFARRAWRRPPAGEEIARVMKLAEGEAQRGGDALAQLRLAVAAVLISPHFLFRAEPDPQPGVVRALGDHELASRLSYLIYGSLPDDPLFEAADGGRLRTAAELRAQAARMLADPRGAAFVGRFASQWLELVELERHDVDPTVIAGFDPALALAMTAETLGFVAEFVASDRPVQELLSRPWTPADARLAAHYGAGGPPRRGLLTQASVLTATSGANGTNPVARGQWVLARLFCAPAPPPPPDVPDLPETAPGGQTVRARLEAHRASPACASCHKLIDPIGLGLENYDAVGRWRTTDAGQTIDAAGELPDGTRFSGPAALIEALARDPRLPGCVAQQLFAYAVGRAATATPDDSAHLQALLERARGPQAGLGSLLHALLDSDVFRLRRGEP